MSNVEIARIMLEFWGAFFCALAAIVMSFSVSRAKRSSSIIQWMLLINMDNLIADAFTIIFAGHRNGLGIFMTRFCSFISVLSLYALVVLATHYVFCLVRENGGRNLKAILYLVGVILIFPIISLIVNLFNGCMYYFDEMNEYHRGQLFYGIMGTVLLAMYVCLVIVIMNRKKIGVFSTIATLLYLLVPVALMAIQAYNSGFSYVNVGITITLLMMMVAYQKEQAVKQNRLQQSQAELLLGQIKPDFIDNTLSRIEEYCVIDSHKARDMIKNLSGYMKDTFTLMQGTPVIDFNQEMQLIDYYINLELAQSPAKVTVQKKLEVTDFKVPALSVEPLVENAFRHGIANSKEEHIIVIRTFETPTDFVVGIFDDGSGFDDSVLEDASHKLDGIQTIRDRIEGLAAGRLEIESKLGEGTAVAIYLPKGKEEKGKN